MPGKILFTMAVASLGGNLMFGTPGISAVPNPVNDGLQQVVSTHTAPLRTEVRHRRICARWVWTRSRPPRRVCIRWISPPHLIDRERVRPPIPDPGPYRRPRPPRTY